MPRFNKKGEPLSNRGARLIPPFNHALEAEKTIASFNDPTIDPLERDSRLFCLLHHTRYRGHIEDPVAGLWQVQHYPQDMDTACTSTQPRHDNIPQWSQNLNEAMHLAAQVAEHFDDALSIKVLSQGAIVIRLPGQGEEMYQITTPNQAVELAAFGISKIVALVCSHTQLRFKLSPLGASKVHRPPIIDDRELEAIVGERVKTAANKRKPGGTRHGKRVPLKIK